MKAVCLWSGGKDSCLACYKAKAQGHEIIYLVNFANSVATHSISHGLTAANIRKQASRIGIPFIQKAMPEDNYEGEFNKFITEQKNKNGIEGIVFGDIYLQEHKDWIDRVCSELKVIAVFPLWGGDTTEIFCEFLNSGFKAIIVSAHTDFLGKEWLGRKIDTELLKQIKAKGNIDPCGENGEFHTFVYDGPFFKKPVDFVIGRKVKEGKHWFLKLG